MADKQTQALKRLAKKLSALRKTLRKDERELLDALILGDEAAAEVKAHRAAGATVSKAAAVAEVKAHRLAGAATAAATVHAMIEIDAVNGKYVIAEKEPEVEGHMVSSVVTSKSTPTVLPKVAL